MLTSPQFAEGQRLQNQYRAYRVVAEKVLFQGDSKIVIHGDPPVHGEPWVNDWILLDKGNGNPGMGFGFVWVFKTRQAARDFRNKMNADPRMTQGEECQWHRVSGPWRAAAAKQRLLHLWRHPLRGRR